MQGFTVMLNRSVAIASIILGNTLGFVLLSGEVAQAEVAPCLSSSAIASVNFGDDCKAFVVGRPALNIEQFRIGMTRQLSIAIAQYNTNFAVAYAPRTVNGLIAVRYQPDSTLAASVTQQIECSACSAQSGLLGGKISQKQNPQS
jgi:PIN domain nuclease of toxin-antitoxin system